MADNVRRRLFTDVIRPFNLFTLPDLPTEKLIQIHRRLWLVNIIRCTLVVQENS